MKKKHSTLFKCYDKYCKYCNLLEDLSTMQYIMENKNHPEFSDSKTTFEREVRTNAFKIGKLPPALEKEIIEKIKQEQASQLGFIASYNRVITSILGQYIDVDIDKACDISSNEAENLFGNDSFEDLMDDLTTMGEINRENFLNLGNLIPDEKSGFMAAFNNISSKIIDKTMTTIDEIKRLHPETTLSYDSLDEYGIVRHIKEVKQKENKSNSDTMEHFRKTKDTTKTTDNKPTTDTGNQPRGEGGR